MASKGSKTKLKGKLPDNNQPKGPWLNDHGALVDYTNVASAPNKDFFHVFVTPDEFVFRVWKIVPPTRADSNVPPYEYKDTYAEFLNDDRCHSEIVKLAGENTLKYLLEVRKGHLDFLCRIPHEALIKIILNLDLQDIFRLGSVNRYFREICNSDELWQKIYCICSETPITPELEALARDKGWKRLFFTNRLQLQMQLRRLKIQENDQQTTEQQEVLYTRDVLAS